jgi:hypothetical protein
MKDIIVNNHGKNTALFPKLAEMSRDDLRSRLTLHGAARALGAVERSILSFLAALPVVDVAFVLLVVAYVKSS